jgi:hypothetical protein
MSLWTEGEIAILRDAYSRPTVDLSVLSIQFKRSRQNICRKAREIGLPTNVHRKHSPEAILAYSLSRSQLTPGDRQWLRENYNNHTDVELGNILKKSRSSIRHFLSRSKLIRDIKARGWKHRNGHPRGFLGHKHDPSSREIMGVASRAAWSNPKSKLNSPEERQRRSDVMVASQRNGLIRNRYSRGRMGKRADLGGLYVRSSWEANYARYLNWIQGRGEIQSWSYEADRFDFPVKRGTRSYMPDFKVIENDGAVVYHEVKGWMTQKGQTALNRMKTHYPNVRVILIAKKEYQALSKWRGLIPGWE